MPNTEESGFPAALDTVSTFLPMKDAPSGESTLSSGIDTTQNTLPVADRAKFYSGTAIVTIEGTNEICKYTGGGGSVGAGNLTGVSRNWGNNIGGIAGTGVAASTGAKVRHLMTWEHFRLIVDALLALEVTVGKTADPNAASHDNRIATLEGAIAGSPARLVVVSAPQVGCSNGNLVRFNGTDFVPCDISLGHIPLGIIHSISGAAGTVVVAGSVASGVAGLTPGATYYAGASGVISITPSKWEIGVAISATELQLNIFAKASFPLTIEGATINAGTVTNGKVVYYDRVNSRYDLADANGAHSWPPIGIAKNVSGSAADIVVHGIVAGLSGLTAGEDYFLSNTAGALVTPQQDQDSYHQWLLGKAVSATELYVTVHWLGNADETVCDNDNFATIAGSTVQDALDSIDDYLTTFDYTDVSANDGATDVTGAELERLSDGSDVSSSPQLHHHDYRYGDGGLWSKGEQQMVPNDNTGAGCSLVGWETAQRQEQGGMGAVVENDGIWLDITTDGISTTKYRAIDHDYRTNRYPEFVARVKTGASIAGIGMWIGLFSGAVGTIGGATPALSLAAFRYWTGTDGTAFWRTATDNGSGSPTVTITTQAIATGSIYLLRIIVAPSQITFYINDVLVATHSLTLPAAGTDLHPLFQVGNNGSTLRQLKVGRLALRSL